MLVEQDLVAALGLEMGTTRKAVDLLVPSKVHSLQSYFPA
jgi:hypothetical protein